MAQAPDWVAPYIPFRTLLNLVERMERETPPQRVDRTYLDNLSGAQQGQVITALRALDLIDEANRPSGTLLQLVAERERRKELFAGLLRQHYSWALDLATQNGTQGQLMEAFGERGSHGDTRRKAVTFFLNAAAYAELPLSPHWQLPRGTQGAEGRTARRGPRKTRKTGKQGRERVHDDPKPPPSASSVEQLRVRYIDMLMKKAEATDELDADLLDRIESLLGFEVTEADQEAEEEAFTGEE